MKLKLQNNHKSSFLTQLNSTEQNKELISLIEKEVTKQISENQYEFLKNFQNFEVKTYDNISELRSQITNTDNKINMILSNEAEIKILSNNFENLENKFKVLNDKFLNIDIKFINLNKDYSESCYKYDKMILDNLLVPGYIGPGNCKFKNLKEFLEDARNNFNNLENNFKKNLINFEEYKKKLEILIDKFNSLVNNYQQYNIQYTNNKLLETEKKFIDKFYKLKEDYSKIQIENLDKVRNISNDISFVKNEKINISLYKNELNETNENFYKKITNKLKKQKIEIDNFKIEFFKIKKSFQTIAEFIKDVRFKRNIMTNEDYVNSHINKMVANLINDNYKIANKNLNENNFINNNCDNIIENIIGPKNVNNLKNKFKKMNLRKSPIRKINSYNNKVIIKNSLNNKNEDDKVINYKFTNSSSSIKKPFDNNKFNKKFTLPVENLKNNKNFENDETKFILEKIGDSESSEEEESEIISIKEYNNEADNKKEMNDKKIENNQNNNIIIEKDKVNLEEILSKNSTNKNNEKIDENSFKNNNNKNLEDIENLIEEKIKDKIYYFEKNLEKNFEKIQNENNKLQNKVNELNSIYRTEITKKKLEKNNSLKILENKLNNDQPEKLNFLTINDFSKNYSITEQGKKTFYPKKNLNLTVFPKDKHNNIFLNYKNTDHLFELKPTNFLNNLEIKRKKSISHKKIPKKNAFNKIEDKKNYELIHNFSNQLLIPLKQLLKMNMKSYK